jgi:hypothetical protein
MSLLLDIPAHDAQRRAAAKQNGDQKCPCMMCRFTRPVKSDRSRRNDTPSRVFTSPATAVHVRVRKAALVFGHEDQMNVNGGNHVPATAGCEPIL